MLLDVMLPLATQKVEFRGYDSDPDDTPIEPSPAMANRLDKFPLSPASLVAAQQRLRPDKKDKFLILFGTLIACGTVTLSATAMYLGGRFVWRLIRQLTF
jgi:hypothetical protein